MSTPFLIAHKVSGLPAFDIARRLPCPLCQVYENINGEMVGDEKADCFECDGLGYWWIIPTSGHRAHPYWDVSLTEFWLGGELQVLRAVPDMPEGHPDHYPSRLTPQESTDLVALLGFTSPPPILKRL